MKALLFAHSIDYKHRESLKRVKAEVVLGSPGARCRGVGICRISAADTLTTSHSLPRCRKTVAWIGLTPGGSLYMIFSKHLVCDTLAERQFKPGSFGVTTRFRLPQFLQNELGTTREFIEPGNYPVRESAQQWIVYFT